MVLAIHVEIWVGVQESCTDTFQVSSSVRVVILIKSNSVLKMLLVYSMFH